VTDLILDIEYELNDDVRELVCGLLDLLSEIGEKYLGLWGTKVRPDGDRVVAALRIP
jgi:hypothetical protein